MEEIMSWLDKNIGTDIATYLSLFIGVVAIFFVVRNFYLKIKQSQSINNGTGIQAGRDVNIKRIDRYENSKDK